MTQMEYMMRPLKYYSYRRNVMIRHIDLREVHLCQIKRWAALAKAKFNFGNHKGL
jgi:hypothetical protein